MTAYATVTELREYLDQLGASNTTDVVLQRILDRATSIIDTYLGYTFSDYPAVATVKYVPGLGTSFLALPPHLAGSITSVTPENATALPNTLYQEQEDGSLYFLSSYAFTLRSYWIASPNYYGIYGWGFFRYAVTAIWGYGPPPPAVVEVCIELAMNMWRGKDKGFWSEAIGASGGSYQTYTGGLPRRLAEVLDAERLKYLRVVI